MRDARDSSEDLDHLVRLMISNGGLFETSSSIVIQVVPSYRSVYSAAALVAAAGFAVEEAAQ